MTAPLVRPPKPLLGPSVHTGLDITAFVCAFVLPPAALFLGIAGIGSAHRDGRHASPLSVAAVVIAALVIAIVLIVIIAVAANQPDPVQQYVNCVNEQLNNPGLVCPTP